MKMHRFIRKAASTVLGLSLLALFSTPAHAVLKHEYLFDGNTNDSVGTAHLTLSGNASVSGSELVLTNTTGGARTENATAGVETASIDELAGTINGTDQLSIVIRYNTTNADAWSKLLMLGDGTDVNNYLDITPHRGSPDGDVGMSFRQADPVNEQVTTLPINVPDGTDAYAVGIWDETTDSITLYSMQAGNSTTLGTNQGSMNGGDLGTLSVTEFYLGSPVFWGDSDYVGKIDSVQIYDHALSASEVYDAVDFSLLTLEVNTTDGSVSIKNNSTESISFDYYEVTSDNSPGLLSTGDWDSLDDQNLGATLDGDFNNDGSVDAADYTVWRDGNGPSSEYDLWVANYGETATGGGWAEAGGSDANILSELLLEGDGTVIAPGGSLDLGSAFNTSVLGAGVDGDLEFKFGRPGGLFEGSVQYVTSSATSVPEPSSAVLLMVTLAGVSRFRPRRTA